LIPRSAAAWCALWLAAGAVYADDESPTFAEKSQGFEKDITRLEAIDASYPPALLAHLNYAAFLIANRDEDCVKRLDLAESHRASVAANVATALLLPDGPARVTGMESEIASGRAFCADNDQAAKDRWLPVARENAAAAIPLYRAIHDYVSMAVAQYNLAFADHSLGNAELASQELREALVTDERYGFREDAEYNYRKLHEWEKHPVTDVQVAEYLNSFAGRYAQMTFAWVPASGTAIQRSRTDKLMNGRSGHGTMEAQSTFDIARSGDDFLLSSSATSIKTDFGAADKNPGLDARLSAALTQVYSDSPKVMIGRTGQFKGLQDGEAFRQTLIGRLKELPEKLAPPGDPDLAAIKQRIEPMLQAMQSTDYLASLLRTNYSIETGMWIGATLIQHRRLQFTMAMTMPGTPNGFLIHTVRFELAGWVPCESAMERPKCVELLIDAEPEEDSLRRAKESFSKSGNGDITYWSNTRIALVVDPDTLSYYGRETRTYAYLAVKKGAQREVEISAQVRDDRPTYR
jgi:hypothetical protein